MSWRDKAHHGGLLMMRVGLGAMMMAHGWPKIAGGSGTWKGVGKAVKWLGIDGGYEYWGLAAASAEFFGGALLIIGFGTRAAALAIAGTMVVAAAMHLGKGDGFSGASHAIEVGIAHMGLLLLGGGKYSLDARVWRS